MQSSFDPRGLFRCCNRVVMIKPSPKPWGCWHTACLMSVSLSPHSPQLLDCRRGVEDAASTPEVCRGCGDVSFDTLPKIPLASQELPTTWKGVILTPGLLALGHKAWLLPLSPHQLQAPHQNKSQLEEYERAQRSSREQRAKMIPSFFIWLKNISLCKQSLCSCLTGCPGRRHTHKESGICV